MKTITLTLANVAFESEFKAVVTKVTNPSGPSTITLDQLPKLAISLGESSAESLGIKKDIQVTIEPVKDATDGSFTLSVGEMVKPQPKVAPTRSSGSLSNRMGPNSLSL